MFRTISLYLLGSLLIISCKDPREKYAEIDAAMKQYDQLLVKGDAQGIANAYTEDGNFSNLAKGRDSIRRFHEVRKSIRILEHQSTTLTVNIDKEVATQEGVYDQLEVNGADTLKTQGKFIAEWVYVKGEGWKLKKLLPRPLI